MIKNTGYLTILVGLFLGCVGLVLVAPYHIYTLTLTEGISTSFLVMNPSTTIFYDGDKIALENKNETIEERSELYSALHFSNFEIPFPIKNPLFAIVPTIKIEAGGERLGASFLDGNNVVLFSFVLERPYQFEIKSGDQKLFLLPVFRNYILRKSVDDLWLDMFSKKLSLPSNSGENFFKSLFELRKVSYHELVYSLFILYNRNLFFPSNSQRFYYNSSNKQGIVELPSDDPKYLEERFYLLEKGMVYSIKIKTKKGHLAAEKLRHRVLTETVYKNSTKDSAISVYAQYTKISYGNRIDQLGMTYLFSAWSHDLSNRDFIRVIILFLERGTANLKYLKPFYEYAYKKFGSNFTTENELLLENANEKIKRKTKEELDLEVKSEEQKNNSTNDGKFGNSNDQVNFYLKKAKEDKLNSDDHNQELIQE